ncbi:MAG: UDP-N-acetylmuramoyl-L-alanine--D-glutamate ligase [Cellvibrionaceae bacterium]|nr:UDP-N-acetylmuramoyl-L-alanine--D-glutamate ligase [Cellvibrionaceae bacterium]
MTLIASSQLTVILGLGVTGLSVARFFKAQGKAFVLMDSRAQPPALAAIRREFADSRLYLGALDKNVLVAADEIIISPGLSLQLPEIQAAIKQGVSVVGDIEIFARHVNKPVVAITGSNAKTTVTTLLGQMAADADQAVAVGGNIGRPALDLLADEVDLYILELSSFQLETTQSLQPLVATVLNVSADHLDRYDTLADYHKAKQRIYRGAKTVLVNREDMLTQPPLGAGVRCFSFGLNKPDRQGFGLLSKEGQAYLAFEFTPLLPVADLTLSGRHNSANALAALALGYIAGLPLPAMLATLSTFAGLPHRCQYVTTIDGVTYINDSKATNVGATQAALTSFAEDSNNIVLIAGGQAKGADFSRLKDTLNSAVALLIVLGRDAHLIADIMDDKNRIRFASSLDEAVAIAKTAAKAGDVVLLSPACASFDMFSGYEARGEQFIAAVHRVAT